MAVKLSEPIKPTTFRTATSREIRRKERYTEVHCFQRSGILKGPRVQNADHGVKYQCVVNFHVCGWRGGGVRSAVRCRKRPLTNCFGESAGRCRDHIPTNWSRSRRCGKRRQGHPTRRASPTRPLMPPINEIAPTTAARQTLPSGRRVALFQ